MELHISKKLELLKKMKTYPYFGNYVQLESFEILKTKNLFCNIVLVLLTDHIFQKIFNKQQIRLMHKKASEPVTPVTWKSLSVAAVISSALMGVLYYFRNKKSKGKKLL